MKTKTMAREVYDNIEKEIESIHPWQYQKLNLISVNYDVILEDIKTYWNQQGRFREGFKVENENIYVPNFFTKINGIHKNKKEYIEFVKELIDSKNTIVLSNDFNLNTVSLDYMNPIGDSKTVLYEKQEFSTFIGEEFIYYEPTIKNILEHKFLGYIIKNSNYTFDTLTSSKQKQILKILKKYLVEKRDEYSKEELETIISICFSIPDNIISLINNFDYSYDIPKIVVTTKYINKKLALLLMVLNDLAIDILLLEPSGKSTIERYMDIGELSLGYFVDDFNMKEEMISKSQKVKENISKFLKNGFNILINNITPLLCYLPLIVILGIVTYGMFKFSGGINTIIQLVALFLIYRISKYIYEEFNDSDIFAGSHIVSFIGICILLFIRFVIFSYSCEVETTTYSGYINIEEKKIVCENGYIIKTKDDAIMQDDSKTLYCYIENNSENDENIYFEVIVGNSIVYTSTKIEPLEYVKQFTIDCNLPIGENKVKIKYYFYDSSLDNPLTEEFLGEKEILVHVAKDYKEFDEFEETYQLNFE